MSGQTIAYRLNLKLDWFTGEAAGHLHMVQCEHCGQHAGNDVAFPLIHASEFPGYVRKRNPKKLGPYISWSEYRGRVVERARSIYNDPELELVPGAALGPIEIEPIGMWPKVLNDINLASPGGLLFSCKLIEAVRARGIDLPFQPTSLSNRKGFPYPFGVMQPRVYGHVVHPETFVRAPHYRCCNYCEEITVLDPFRKPPAQIFLRAEIKGKTSDLFRVTGGYGTFVFLSDRLKSALEELQPTGLELDPYGIWHTSENTEPEKTTLSADSGPFRPRPNPRFIG